MSDNTDQRIFKTCENGYYKATLAPSKKCSDQFGLYFDDTSNVPFAQMRSEDEIVELLCIDIGDNSAISAEICLKKPMTYTGKET